MKEIWNRIEEWLGHNTLEEVLESLNPGATDEEIKAAEEKMAVTFPPDMVAAYKIHNGQADGGPGLMDGVPLISLEEIVNQWEIWKDLLDGGDFEGAESEPSNDGIKNSWWNDKWIPVTYDGAGNHICVDLDPTQTGKSGQLLTMWHDDGVRDLVANSFSEWMQTFADDLQKNVYVFSEDYYGVIKREEAKA